jgi:hypothetical protein
VQWHPEYDWQIDALSRRIFEQFGEIVRAYAQDARHRSGVPVVSPLTGGGGEIAFRKVASAV